MRVIVETAVNLKHTSFSWRALGAPPGSPQSSPDPIYAAPTHICTWNYQCIFFHYCLTWKDAVIKMFFFIYTCGNRCHITGFGSLTRMDNLFIIFIKALRQMFGFICMKYVSKNFFSLIQNNHLILFLSLSPRSQQSLPSCSSQSSTTLHKFLVSRSA